MCRINAGGSPREVEGNCLKYLKGGGIEKRVVKTKIKSRGQAGLRGGLISGAGTLLRTVIQF